MTRRGRTNAGVAQVITTNMSLAALSKCSFNKSCKIYLLVLRQWFLGPQGVTEVNPPVTNMPCISLRTGLEAHLIGTILLRLTVYPLPEIRTKVDHI